jgi:polysaccharide export outer membrane protein
MKRKLFVGTLFLAAVSACAPNNIRSLSELNKADDKNAEYLIQGGDTLIVNVWGEPRLSGPVVVREDGRFTLPLIEDVLAEGKTVKQLSAEVTQKLVAFIPAASVSISVSQSAPIRYYLSGQFVKPGEFRSDRRITLLQAIATGGGFAPFADESEIMLIRKGRSGDLRYRFDYNRVVDGRDPNPELKNGDVVSVK